MNIKGATLAEAPGFRDSPPLPGSPQGAFQFCLCNHVPLKADKSGPVQGPALVLLLHAGSAPTDFPEFEDKQPDDVPEGKVRLYVDRDSRTFRPTRGAARRRSSNQHIPVAKAVVVEPLANASEAAAFASAPASTSGDAYTSPPAGRGGREADVATAPMEPTPEAIQPHFSALQRFYSPSAEHPFDDASSTSIFQGIDELQHIRRLHNAAASDRKFELIWTESRGFCYRCVKTIAAGEPLFVYGGQLRYRNDFEASEDREKRERWVYALESSRVQTVIDGYPYQSRVALPMGDPYTTLFMLPPTHLGSLLNEPDSRGAATAVIGDITARQLGLPDTLPPLKIVRASNKAILPGDYITISYGQGSGHIHPHRATNPSQGA